MNTEGFKNLPIELIERYSLKKERLEELACAIILKKNFSNSCIYTLDSKHVRRIFGVSYQKALKLIPRLQASDLFRFTAKGHLVAKSFRSQDTKTYCRGKYSAKADYCIKLKDVPNRLRDVVRMLREILILSQVRASRRNMDEQHTYRFFVEDFAKCDETGLPVVLRAFAKRISMSKSSAYRYISSMKQRGIIDKTGSVMDVVIPNATQAEIDDWYNGHPRKRLNIQRLPGRRGYHGCLYLGCYYEIADGDLSRSFMNVIYDHKKRCVKHEKKAKEIVRNDYHGNFYSRATQR